jgi:hypothetical protein
MLNSSTSALGKTISLTPKNVYDPAGFKLVLSTLGNGDLFFDPSSNAIDLHGVNALASIEIQRPAGQKLLLECFVSHSFSSSAGSGSGATPTVTITASASTSGADQTASPPANQVYNFPVIITTKAGWNQVTFSSAGFWHFHGCDITPMN